MSAFIPPTTTVTTMDVAHDAIVSALRAHFGDRIAAYGAYEPWDTFTDEAAVSLQTPALLLELEGFEIPDGTEPDPLGRLAISCTWRLHAILSQDTPRLQQTLPQFAAVIASLLLPPMTDDAMVRGNVWGLGAAAEPPTRVTAQPGEFAPGLHGRDSWVVRWEQTLYLHQETPA